MVRFGGCLGIGPLCEFLSFVGEEMVDADEVNRSIAVQTMTSLTGVNVIQVCFFRVVVGNFDDVC
jgi:hypothetical protein